MPVVGNTAQTEPAVALELEKVLRSKAFSRADSIRQVLKFIVEEAIDGNSDNIKEYSIATEGLGRSPDFDPKADSIVRVQVQRLRKRLDEYYNHEGARDPLRIEIPAGRYIPTFQAFPPASPAIQGLEPVPAPQLSAPSVEPARMPPNRSLLAIIVVMLGIIAVMGYRLSKTLAPNSNILLVQPRTLPASLDVLWRPFLPPNSPPLITYSNPLFLADDFHGLHRFSVSPGHSLPAGARVSNFSQFGLPTPILSKLGNLYYCDLYTGTGEVVAAAQVARFLTNQDQKFSIERSGLVSFNFSRNANVIFLGGPAEDSHLANLSLQSDLDIVTPDHGFPSVYDLHPAPGKASSYFLKRDPQTQQIMTDYALISLLPAAVPDRFRLVLAGITTLGTQAAAEFATSPPQMAIMENMRRASGGRTRRSPYFQSLLEIEIRGGAIAGINCVFVRGLQFK